MIWGGYFVGRSLEGKGLFIGVEVWSMVNEKSFNLIRKIYVLGIVFLFNRLWFWVSFKNKLVWLGDI